jgi:DNA polymerase-3 subunit epsilon
MRANEPVVVLMDRLRACITGLRSDPLLADPLCHAVHTRVRALKPKTLTCLPVEQTRFVVLDTETTGFKVYGGDEIVSIALLEMHGLEPTGREFTTLVNPGRAIPPASTAVHNICDADVAYAPVIEEVLHDVTQFIGESVLVGHHVPFDLRFLNKALHRKFRCRLRNPWLDTMLMYVAFSGRLGHYTLEDVARFCNVEIRDRHTARGDALMTAAMFKTLASCLIASHGTVSALIRRQTQTGFF